MATPFDTFILDTTNSWYESNTSNALISSTIISVLAAGNLSLGNIHYWLQDSQMLKFIDTIYFPEDGTSSSTSLIQDVITALPIYREDLVQQRVDQSGIVPYVPVGDSQQMIVDNVENTSPGSDLRFDVLIAMLLLTVYAPTITEEAILNFPRVQNDRNENDKLIYYKQVCIPGYTYVSPSASFLALQPIINNLINQQEGAITTYVAQA